MVCDQATASTAQVFTYTGSGLSVGGVPMVSTGPGEPLVLANSTTQPLTGSSDDMTFPKAGENIV
jgi:hypothetical protein